MTIIADKNFICGEHQTPVDYLLACELMTIFYLLKFKLSELEYPNVCRWWNTIINKSELKDAQDMYHARMEKV
jgi:glutathione S-transferase